MYRTTPLLVSICLALPPSIRDYQEQKTAVHLTPRKSNMASVSVVESLRQQIASCEAQLADLRQQLAEAEQYQQQRAKEQLRHVTHPDPLTHDMTYGIHDDFRSEVFAALSQASEEQPQARKWPLDRLEYKRYGRQLIMPEVGLQGIVLFTISPNTFGLICG
jgi:TolA-binding protein